MLGELYSWIIDLSDDELYLSRNNPKEHPEAASNIIIQQVGEGSWNANLSSRFIEGELPISEGSYDIVSKYIARNYDVKVPSEAEIRSLTNKYFFGTK